MYESCCIVGNVGASPEVRYTQEGDVVANFSVCVNSRWKDAKSGEVRERAKWFRVSAWKQLAETVAQYVTKGMKVLVEGEISASGFQDNTGKVRGSLELRARTIRFLSARPEGEAEGEMEEDEGGVG